MSEDDKKQLVEGTQRWSVQSDPETGELGWEWNPSAPDDIDELFTRVDSGNATPLDSELFHACILDRFITQANWGEGKVDPWILRTLSEMFFKVLAGGEWNDEIRLPGRPVSSPWSQKEQRDLSIYCDVANAVNLQGSKPVAAIQRAADEHCVSYETARAGYYHWKNRLSKKPQDT